MGLIRWGRDWCRWRGGGDVVAEKRGAVGTGRLPGDVLRGRGCRVGD